MRYPAVVASVTDLDAGDTRVADAIELRLDLSEATPAALRHHDGSTPVIVTNRPTWAGGLAPEGPERLEAIAAALEAHPVWAIDLEYAVLAGEVGDELRSATERVMARVGASDVHVICSMHETTDDPAGRDLFGRARETATHGDIGKVVIAPETHRGFGALAATMAAVREAALPVACMAMGAYGPPSRALSIAMGAPLVYGHPPGAEPTADGQPSIGLLRSLVNAFNTADVPAGLDERRPG